MQTSDEQKLLGQRIRGLREACDITPEDMAAELGIDPVRYEAFENTGADVPISVVFHLARRFNVDFNEILTGGEAKLDSIQVVRAGQGRTVDRYPGYHFQDLAWRYGHKIMQPLLVTLDPSDEPAALVQHDGQEFNMVLSGTMALAFDDREIILEAGDSVYFSPTHAHGQKCASSVPTVFLTVIIE